MSHAENNRQVVVATAGSPDPLASVQAAAAMIDRGDPAAALRILNLIPPDFRRSLPYLLVRSYALKGTGCLRRARAVLEELITSFPDLESAKALHREVCELLRKPISAHPLDIFRQRAIQDAADIGTTTCSGVAELSDVILFPASGLVVRADGVLVRETCSGMSDAELVGALFEYDGDVSELQVVAKNAVSLCGPETNVTEWIARRNEDIVQLLSWDVQPQLLIISSIAGIKEALVSRGFRDEQILCCENPCRFEKLRILTGKTAQLPPATQRRKSADSTIWRPVVERQLAQWNDCGGVTSEAIQETLRECSEALRIRIQSNRIIEVAKRGRRVNWPRAFGYIALLEDTMANFAVPDLEMIISTTDLPISDHQQTEMDVPVFSFAARDDLRSLMIPFPRFARDDLSLTDEKRAPPQLWANWDETRMALGALADRIAWEHKQPKVIFAGHMVSFNDVRLKYCAFALNHPHRYEMVLRNPNAELSAMLKGTPLESNVNRWLPMAEYPKYRYLLHLDGVSTSERLRYLLAMDSVVLKHASPYSEFYYPLLNPHEHFVPLDANLQELPAAISRLEENPTEAQAISRSARAFVNDRLSYASVLEYMAELLKGYASLCK